jgi:hypothetical protein
MKKILQYLLACVFIVGTLIVCKNHLYASKYEIIDFTKMSTIMGGTCDGDCILPTCNYPISPCQKCGPPNELETNGCYSIYHRYIDRLHRPIGWGVMCYEHTNCIRNWILNTCTTGTSTASSSNYTCAQVFQEDQ